MIATINLESLDPHVSKTQLTQILCKIVCSSTCGLQFFSNPQRGLWHQKRIKNHCGRVAQNWNWESQASGLRR